jgi:hypothetical protein
MERSRPAGRAARGNGNAIRNLCSDDPASDCWATRGPIGKILRPLAIEPARTDNGHPGATASFGTSRTRCRQDVAGCRLRRRGTRRGTKPAWRTCRGARCRPCDDFRCTTARGERSYAVAVRRGAGRGIAGELGRWSLWSAYRRVRGWFGNPTWRAAKFCTAEGLRRLVTSAGLEVLEIRGAVYYPPCAVAAWSLAPFDFRIGQKTAFGSAFLALRAVKPSGSPRSETV